MTKVPDSGVFLPPTVTGAAKAVGLVLPQPAVDRITGAAVLVP